MEATPFTAATDIATAPTDDRRILELRKLLTAGKLATYVHLLPLFFNLNGKPYSLKGHAPFEPAFSIQLPSETMFKAGRQTAKSRCTLHADAMTSDRFGRPLQDDELTVGTELLSLGDGYRFTTGTIVGRHENPPEPCVKIRTRMGADLYLSTTHELRVLDGYKAAGELVVGDRLAALRRGGEFDELKVDRSRIVATAYLIGDGCLTGTTPGLTSGCREIVDEYCDAVEEINGVRPSARLCDGKNAWVMNFGYRTKLARLLEEAGLLGKYSWEKRLPKWVFHLDEQDTRLFLSRLWATDGMIKAVPRGVVMSYSTTSRLLSRDVRALLSKLGIPASVLRRKADYKKNGVYKRCRDVYITRVETATGQRLFNELLRVPGKPAVDPPGQREKSNRDTYPKEVQGWITELIAHAKSRRKYPHGSTLEAVGLRSTLKYPPSQAKLRSYLAYFEGIGLDHPRVCDLRNLIEGDTIWDEVVEITHLPDAPTWDIEVDGHHNYVLDGVVSHNSTALASSAIIRCMAIPYFGVLFVTPLYEQIRRFSTNYVKPFIDESPLKALWTGPGVEKNVLQRTFSNRSKMQFSFALKSADRCRGISTHANCFDELQDADVSIIPIVKETMGASTWRLSTYAGTPKTLDNAVESFWSSCSQAEWCIPCDNCKHLNVPKAGHDLEKMIGPARDDICIANPATICARCRGVIHPIQGRWYHAYPERRADFPGYHIPQIIMPIHYGSKKRWGELLGKQQGYGNCTVGQFYNEVLGESYDTGAKLVSKTDLEQASILPWENEPLHGRAALARKDDYVVRILGVDWGGGGESRRGGGKEGSEAMTLSFTCCAVLGLRGDGRLDVIYGRRLLTPHDHLEEAKQVLRIYNMFGCHGLAHDYNGAGSLRETIMIQAGLPSTKIAPIVYGMSAKQNIMVLHKTDERHSRNFWYLDKPRSLLLTCQCIKLQRIVFFKQDYKSKENRGLQADFLSLVENKVESARGPELYTITRNPSVPDDFAHAVNFAACTIWQETHKWPNVAQLANLRATVEQLNQIAPAHAWHGAAVTPFLQTP
jgi:intein/homing endonuclease